MSSSEQLPFPEPGEEIQTLTFETLLARLESNIALLAEGAAPLDQLVAAHQQAAGLLSEAALRLESLKARADELVVALRT
ncbi:MAG TPA: exodeoxyribonuclease VII small subunit [Candidatus Dormibacteraeota bacterium]|jgi:exonuclease VII small subunit